MKPQTEGKGDTWRWNAARHSRAAHCTIQVIERPKGDEPPRGKRAVPFGFGPRDEPEWEGNPS